MFPFLAHIFLSVCPGCSRQGPLEGSSIHCPNLCSDVRRSADGGKFEAGFQFATASPRFCFTDPATLPIILYSIPYYHARPPIPNLFEAVRVRTGSYLRLFLVLWATDSSCMLYFFLMAYSSPL